MCVCIMYLTSLSFLLSLLLLLWDHTLFWIIWVFCGFYWCSYSACSLKDHCFLGHLRFLLSYRLNRPHHLILVIFNSGFCHSLLRLLQHPSICPSCSRSSPFSCYPLWHYSIVFKKTQLRSARISSSITETPIT